MKVTEPELHTSSGKTVRGRVAQPGQDSDATNPNAHHNNHHESSRGINNARCSA